MADRSSVSMYIGGTIKLSDLGRLCETAAEEYAGLDWQGAEADQFYYAAIEAHRAEEPLLLSNHEVSSGHWEDLETLCRELNLPYKVQCDACCGAWGAMLDFWEPAGPGVPDDVLNYACDEDGGWPMLSARSIRKLLAAEELETDGLRAELEKMERVERFPFPLVLVDDCADERARLLAELAELDRQREGDGYGVSEGPADIFADRRREIAGRLDEIGTEAP